MSAPPFTARDFCGLAISTAYLIDCAGRNPVCVAQYHATDEPLIATVAGWHFYFEFSVDGSRAIRGGGSSSQTHSSAATHFQAAAANDLPNCFGANDSRERLGAGLIIHATGVCLCRRSACDRYSDFIGKEGRIHANR